MSKQKFFGLMGLVLVALVLSISATTWLGLHFKAGDDMLSILSYNVMYAISSTASLIGIVVGAYILLDFLDE